MPRFQARTPAGLLDLEAKRFQVYVNGRPYRFALVGRQVYHWVSGLLIAEFSADDLQRACGDRMAAARGALGRLVEERGAKPLADELDAVGEYYRTRPVLTARS